MFDCQIKEVSIKNDTFILIIYHLLLEITFLKTLASRKHTFAFLNLLAVILNLEIHGNIKFP